MSSQFFTYLALAVYFAAMLGIGIYASRKNTDHEDYMLGGRKLTPWVAALSAGASDMSGWLLMGLPGAVYVAGLIEGWIAIGLTVGAYLNWRLVAPRLRAYTQIANNSITVPSFFENRLRDTTRLLRVTSSLIILVFFTLYISSGMVAGGKFFEVSFGSSYLSGMLLVTAVTLIYTMFGGFLGASLTDVVQGLMLVIAVLFVPIIAVITVGGVSEAFTLVNTLEPGHFDLFGSNGFSTATVLTIVSGLAWGLGYFGQPHIIVRFMAMRSAADATAGRRIGVTWQILSLSGAVFSGLVGIAYVAENNIDLTDPETVLLMMSQTLLHPLIGGLVLAAVLAAIMSTFSSQLIVCSSALVEDLYRVVRKTPPSEASLMLLGRACVFGVAIVAAILALVPNDTVLGLVSFAWAGFGAAFGPIVLLSLYWRKLSNWGALAGMISGTVTVFAWKTLNTGLYELLPAFCIATLVAVIVSRCTYRPHAEIQREFTETGTIVLGKAITATK